MAFSSNHSADDLISPTFSATRRSPFWQAARPRPRAIWVLPVPLLPSAMMFSRRSGIFTARQLHDQHLVERWDGLEVEGMRL